MIEVQCEQGSIDWMQSRLAIPTASAFHKIVTPKGVLSKQSVKYRCQLISEWLVGEPMDEFGRRVLEQDEYSDAAMQWIERGKQLEGEAKRVYAFLKDEDPRQVGFCYQDESRLIGCSPGLPDRRGRRT